jgi:hypothetical protein
MSRFEKPPQIAQILGKHLVSIRLQMGCFGATGELLKQTK